MTAIGDTVGGGRWIIERPLSSGGMGEVYVAKHADTGRAVALKVVKTASANDPELVARFRRETGALALISHPNVVTFLDSGVEAGTFFLVMELLPGRPLRAIMGDGPVDWRRAFRIAADVCRALAAVHKGGIIHRDLKPENIFLVDAEGHDELAKLIDFGIVRLEEGMPGGTASTRTGAIIGTPGYISPEQLQSREPTPASDIYAVGVILYELVVGAQPFAASNVQAVLVRQLIDPLVPPRDKRPELPADVEAIILSLMERDPARRVQTAREALTKLTDRLRAADAAPELPTLTATAPLLTPAPTPTAPTAPSPAAPPPSQRSPARLFGAVAVLAIGVVAGVVGVPRVLDGPDAGARIDASTRVDAGARAGPGHRRPDGAAEGATATDAGAGVVDAGAAAGVVDAGVVDAGVADAVEPRDAGVAAARVRDAGPAGGHGRLPGPPDEHATNAVLEQHRLDLDACGALAEQTMHLTLAFEPNGTVRLAGGKGLAATCLAGRARQWKAAPFSGKPVERVIEIERATAKPAYSFNDVAAIVNRHAAELALCGGDARLRTGHFTVKPDGSMEASSSPLEDFAAKCLSAHVATWRMAPFTGAAVSYDIPVALGR